MIRVGLHGGEKYDSNMLTIHKNAEEERAFGHSMVIILIAYLLSV